MEMDYSRDSSSLSHGERMEFGNSSRDSASFSHDEQMEFGVSPSHGESLDFGSSPQNEADRERWVNALGSFIYRDK